MTLEHMLHDPHFLSVFCGWGAVAVVVLIWMALIENDPLSDRLKSVSEHRDELAHREQNKKLSRHEGLISKNALKRLVQKLKLEQGKKTNQIRLKLARAGFRSREAMMWYLLIRFILPIAAGFVSFFLIFVVHAVSMPFMKEVLSVLGSIFTGVAIPEIFIKNLSQKRAGILRKAMPDALDVLVICAEAGLSLDSALSRVSREMATSCPEIAEEIGLTGVELGFFPDRAQALQNLADRVPIKGVLGLTSTLIQTEKYGTPLAQTLRVLSAEMRNDRIMAAETKAAKLPATLTVPMILFILPPLFVVLLGPAIIKVMALMK
jgi:tight adherence protein C